MKEAKSNCAPPKPPLKPNLKNKDFAQWTRAESCKKDDNIISTDWHETLQRTAPFVPAYANAPLNMVYLLSGEYGRIWQKERDEWYGGVFVSHGREKEMEERKKKIKKQLKEAKKAAQIKIQERKERKIKEAELKAKADAEKAEKLKAKLQKCAAKKEAKKKPKKKQETQQVPDPPSPTQGLCSKGWTPVELTVQCECTHHDKVTDDDKVKNEKSEGEDVRNDKTEDQNSPTLCQDFCKQLKEIQNTQLNKQTPRESQSKTEQNNSGKQDTTCECEGN